MGVLLAWRRLADSQVARFLNDADPRVVLEAARAIHDVPIAGAMPALAALPIASSAPLPLVRRVQSAALRLGRPEHAVALAEAAGRSDLPGVVQVQALELLGQWARPSGRDPVLGLWRPIPARSAEPAVAALRPRLTGLLSASSEAVRSAAALAAAALGIQEAAAPLAGMATDRDQTDRTRAAALKALDQLGDPRRVDAARRAAALPGSRTRIQAIQVLAKADPDAAIPIAQDRLERGSTAERQATIAVLAGMRSDPARRALLHWLDRLIAGTVPPEIQLDLVEAAAAHTEPELRRKLQQYEASKPKDDPLATYREVLAGGNAQRGRSLFTDKTEIACLRCHKARTRMGEIPGGEVGPELSGIGARQNRTYLLESIVSPDKQIAQGFESVVLATSDGKVVTGVLRGEDDKEVRLVTAEGHPLSVPKDTIEDRKRGPSAMPADLVQKLSRTELRDLIEFLASLRTPARTP
jgi:quinoprotein glucose dehydrogenase